ncbi:MAG TPA: hypothetical protein VF963_06585 [Gaiellaceae bacterium]
MNYSVIGRDEILAGKPFTDPEFTRRDAKVMRGMLARERERVQAWQEDTGGHAGGQVERDHDDKERRHLLVVPDRHALLQASGLTVVGFFGRPRESVDHTVLYELEDEVVARMPDYAAVGLLSYYDVEFVKGAYGNLVLFSTPDVPKEWSADAVHRRAVEISPGHYHEVRLHRGSIDGRLLGGGDLAIVSTKYFDFKSSTMWRGLRRFD